MVKSYWMRFFFVKYIRWNVILIALSLTVKAATLIFISGHGSAAKQGKSGSIYNFVENFKKLFGPRKRACIS